MGAKSTDAQSRIQLDVVFAGGHPGLGVEAGGAQVGLSQGAEPAVAAGRAPGQHHVVANLGLGYSFAHRYYHARPFVAQQVWEIIADGSQLIVQVGVANSAGLDAHQDLTGTRLFNDDLFQLGWLPGGPGNYSLSYCRHGYHSPAKLNQPILS
jgi:hypothetical protein